MDYKKRPEHSDPEDGQSSEDLIHCRELSSLDPVLDVHQCHKCNPSLSAIDSILKMRVSRNYRKSHNVNRMFQFLLHCSSYVKTTFIKPRST